MAKAFITIYHHSTNQNIASVQDCKTQAHAYFIARAQLFKSNIPAMPLRQLQHAEQRVHAP